MEFGSPVYNPIRAVRKAADETVNNSVALQNDNELKISAQAQAKYLIDILLLIDAKVASDFKYSWSVPAGATIRTLTSTGAFDANFAESTFDATAAMPTTIGTAGINMLIARFVCVLGVTAGEIQLQWAQNVAVVEDTIVKANSNLVATRLP